MAIYFLHLKTFGRAAGSSGVSAAAYRAGERIRDERTGRTYDHSARQDVLHKEIILPDSVAQDAGSWAQDRAHLWNSAELAETRKNARVAREYLVVLPSELRPEQRLSLAQDFAHELAERYRFAVDLAVHAPRNFPDSDPRNFHAHLLATTREIGAQGLAGKTSLEWNDAKRAGAGLGPAINELLHVRERWAVHANAKLQEANITSRIDHRTLRAQGIDRDPKLWIPRVPYELERRGFRSEVAENIRRQYQERAAAREARQSDLSPAQAWIRYKEAQQPQQAAADAVQEWRKYREQLAAPELGSNPKNGRDDDFTL